MKLKSQDDESNNDFLNLGQGIDKVQFVTLEGANHGSGVMPMYIDVIENLLEAN